MEKQTATGKWSENIILVDADYVDRVTFDLIVNFERITVFGMQPLVGGGFRQEILGYSLMNALGIRSDEIPAE